MNLLNLKENLKYFRELKGYTGKNFAELLGVSYTTYMSYENKNSEPKLNLLVKMASILGITVDELLGNENKNEIYSNGLKAIESLNFKVDELYDEEHQKTMLYIKRIDSNYEEIILSVEKNAFIFVITDIISMAEEEKNKIIREKVKLLIDIGGMSFYGYLNNKLSKNNN